MPQIITDEMIKKMCNLEKPMDLRAIKMLNPSRNKENYKPKYIKDENMVGIRYSELPTYAPANLRGLINAIKNNSKVDEKIIVNYLETNIEREIQKYGDEETKMELDDEEPVFEEFIVDQGGDGVSIVELEDKETQSVGLGSNYHGNVKPEGKEISRGNFESLMTDKERDDIDSGFGVGDYDVRSTQQDQDFKKQKTIKDGDVTIDLAPEFKPLDLKRSVRGNLRGQEL